MKDCASDAAASTAHGSTLTTKASHKNTATTPDHGRLGIRVAVVAATTAAVAITHRY